MIISKYALGTKYRTSQYIGCVFVAAGLAAVLVPMFLSKTSDDSDSDPSEASPLALGLAIATLVLCNIPMSLSMVVKEKALGDTPIDPVFLTFWVALFQWFIGLAVTIPAAAATGVDIKHIPQNLVDGAKCYLGINSVVPPETAHAALTSLGVVLAALATQTRAADPLVDGSDHAGLATSSASAVSVAAPSTAACLSMPHHHQQQQQQQQPQSPPLGLAAGNRWPTFDAYLRGAGSGQRMDGRMGTGDGDGGDGDTLHAQKYDDCARAPIYVNLYLFFNIIYNVLVIMVITYGSANILAMASSAMVPLSSAAFAFKFMPNHKKMKLSDILGLVVIMFGLVIYRFYTQIRQSLCGKSLDDLAEELLVATENKHHAVRTINGNEGDGVLYDGDAILYDSSSSINHAMSDPERTQSYVPPTVPVAHVEAHAEEPETSAQPLVAAASHADADSAPDSDTVSSEEVQGLITSTDDVDALNSGGNDGDETTEVASASAHTDVAAARKKKKGNKKK
jgi:hypothetical protein